MHHEGHVGYAFRNHKKRKEESVQKGAVCMVVKNGKIILKRRDAGTIDQKEKADIAAFMGLKGILKSDITLDELRAERMNVNLAGYEYRA